jgi:hypothetical protein
VAWLTGKSHHTAARHGAHNLESVALGVQHNAKRGHRGARRDFASELHGLEIVCEFRVNKERSSLRINIVEDAACGF